MQNIKSIKHGLDFNKSNDLNERTKELKCLYGVFKLFNMTDTSQDKIMQDVAELIPSGWQFPEIACARLIIGDTEYCSKGYKPGEWVLNVDIAVNKENVGYVEIIYTEKRPDYFKGPFLEEEIYLLEAVASLIGQSIQRKKLEDEKIRLFKDLELNYRKILSGFIPICASCKNIRDEKGAWQQIEYYVQNRTDAQFSHGLCPDCVRKLYPDIKD